MWRTKTTSQERRGSLGVEPSAGTVHFIWPFAGTGMLTIPCTFWSVDVLVAKIASVSGGAGIVSVCPGTTRTWISATMPCMPSCGYCRLMLPPANPLG